jgi:hypothetical protein
LAACAALFAQSASTDQNSASVAGVVVNAVTGEPVLRAHVMLFGFADGKQFRYGAMTTADGKFSVTGLPGASYGVSANRPGFVAGQSGSTGLTLKPGDHKDDVTLKLTPTGSIAGTVVNADGEPVENCNVTAESGRGGQVSQSDAQGRFRIGGLMPGKYRIRATPEEPLTPPEIRTDGTLEAHYSQTYYPSSLDEAGAARVSVEAGTEAAGNEIRLVRTPIVRVSGRVTGIPPGAENVALIAQRGRDSNQGFSVGLVRNTVWSGGAQVKKDGTFTLWRLAPGPYRLGAQWNSPTGQMSAAAPVDIVVGDSNIDGIELRMMPAADLTGQVEYESDDAKSAEPAEGAKPARRPKPQVQLQGIDGNNWAATGQVDAAGAFTLSTTGLPLTITSRHVVGLSARRPSAKSAGRTAARRWGGPGGPDQVGALAGSSEPISFSMPSTRAPPMVAISSAVAGSTSGSSVVTFCSLAARSISSNILKSLLLPAGPSGPSRRDAQRQHAHHRRHAAGQLHIARWAVRHAHAARFQDRHVGLVHPDAVRRHRAAVEDAQLSSVWTGSCGASPARRRSPSWFPKGGSPAARGAGWRARARPSASRRNWCRARAAPRRARSAGRPRSAPGSVP